MKTILCKQIHSGFSAVQTGDVFLEIELDLPFLPSPQVTFLVGDYEEIVEEVFFDIKNNLVKCFMQSDKTLYDKGLHSVTPFTFKDKETFNKIVSDHIKQGWKQNPETE